MNLANKHARQYYNIVQQDRAQEAPVTQFSSCDLPSYVKQRDAKSLSYFGVRSSHEVFMAALDAVYLKINGHSQAIPPADLLEHYDRMECFVLSTPSLVIPNLFICVDPLLTDPEKDFIVRTLEINRLIKREKNILCLLGS